MGPIAGQAAGVAAKPEQGMVALVPAEVRSRPPSQEDGIEADVERELRSFGAGLVQSAGMLLRLPQLTIVSAAVIFQRFYFQKSFADFDVRISATAALALACKLEENNRKLQQVITACHRVQMRALLEEESDNPAYAGKPTPGFEVGSHDYTKNKDDVVRAERHILRELQFDMIVLFLDHPHKYLLQYVKALECPELVQKAWNYLNDSSRTSLCCAYQPHFIALASIYLAARASGTKLPSRPPWWEAFDIDFKDLRAISKAIMAMHRRPLPEYIYIPRKKKETALPPDTPATDTPAPAKSPSDDTPVPAALGDEEAGNAGGLESSLDADRDVADPVPPVAAPQGGAASRPSAEEDMSDPMPPLRREKDKDRADRDKPRDKERDKDKEKDKRKSTEGKAGDRKKEVDARRGRDTRNRGNSNSSGRTGSPPRRSRSRGKTRKHSRSPSRKPTKRRKGGNSKRSVSSGDL